MTDDGKNSIVPYVKESPSVQRPSLLKRTVGRAIRKTGYTLTRVVPKTDLVCQHIPGWFSIHEAEALYLLAATSSASRILEIGHFVGRSTSVICEAIRDTDRDIEFNSYDLGFTDSSEFVAHYKRLDNTTSTDVPTQYIGLVFSQNTTTSVVAKQHLDRFSLGGFVKLISGDFTALDKTKYGLIFCDALHDAGEIAEMMPHVIAASDDDCIWAFHDMNSENLACVQSQTNAQPLRTVDTLGIFRFRRTKP